MWVAMQMWEVDHLRREGVLELWSWSSHLKMRNGKQMGFDKSFLKQIAKQRDGKPETAPRRHIRHTRIETDPHSMTIEIIGLPPTSNHYYKSSGNKRYKPANIKQWYELAARTALLSARGKFSGGFDAKIVLFGLPANRDVDNTPKMVLDPLKRICFDDDRQMRNLSVEPIEGEHGPRVRLILTRI
jgi:Holliday junction resolvase RusA-like endonuclease